MYKWENQILEQYPVEVTETRKGRGVICCISGSETYLLKEYRASEERAACLHDVICYLNMQGLRVPQILCNKEGGCTSVDRDGVRYLLTENVTGRECDTRNREDILEAVRTLARLHKALAAYIEEMPQTMREKAEVQAAGFVRHNRELRHIAKYLKGRRGKKEFEQLFLKAYPHFLQQGQEMEERACRFYQAHTQLPTALCHGDYSQHNVLLTRKGTVVTNFEQMRYGEQMSDLGYFMRKILEKQNWNAALGQDMLHTYDSLLPMDEAKMQQLYFSIGYPEKFWKVANHYYNSRKSWVSNRHLEKMQRVLIQEENRCRFLKSLT